MYINIGQNVLIKKNNITAIFDIETTTGSEITRNFLGKATKRQEIVSVTEDLPRSMIIYSENGKNTIYVSSFSTSLLKKRCLEHNIIN